MQTGWLGRCILCLSLCVAGRALADCQGGPVFPDTIYAQDKNTLVWQTTLDVDFAKGQLQQLSSYTIWARGHRSQATTLDVSRDNPGAGSAIFYLVKTAAAPCGSWQSTPNAEPGRDIQIVPGCTSVNPTDEQIDDAVDAAIALAPNPWGDPDDAMSFHESLQSSIGCAFELIEAGSSVLDTTRSSAPVWDPSHQYCGLGSTMGQPAWISWFPGVVGMLPAGPCLNEACFVHDSCYFSNCVGGACIFSPASTAVGCDHPLVLDACDSGAGGCIQADGPLWRYANKAICRIALALTITQVGNPLCGDLPCDDLLPCTGDACTNGACVHADLCLPMSQPCLAFFCTPWGCMDTMPPDCNDGDVCTVGDYCQDFQCVSGNWTDCDDGNSCTIEYCDSTLGCVVDTLPDGSNCDDSDGCTLNDTCGGGLCTGAPWTSCDDGIACTSNDRCVNGLCAGTPSDAACDDGVWCTTDDCNPTNGCMSWSNCPDDFNMCTDDICDVQLQACVYVPVPYPCP